MLAATLQNVVAMVTCQPVFCTSLDESVLAQQETGFYEE